MKHESSIIDLSAFCQFVHLHNSTQLIVLHAALLFWFITQTIKRPRLLAVPSKATFRRTIFGFRLTIKFHFIFTMSSQVAQILQNNTIYIAYTLIFNIPSWVSFVYWNETGLQFPNGSIIKLYILILYIYKSKSGIYGRGLVGCITSVF